MCSTIKRLLPLLFVVSLTISSFSQSGNQGGIKTTNSPFAGALLITDGSKYYWGYPTNLQVNATNAQPPSAWLTNLSNTGAITNASTSTFRLSSGILSSLGMDPRMSGVEFYDDFDRDGFYYRGCDDDVSRDHRGHKRPE